MDTIRTTTTTAASATPLASDSIRTDVAITPQDQVSVWARQPVKITAGIIAAAVAIIQLLVAYGIDFTDAQRAAIMAVISVIVAPVMAWVIVPRVFAPASVAAIEQRALLTGDQLVPATDPTAAIDTAAVKQTVQQIAELQQIAPPPDAGRRAMLDRARPQRIDPVK